MENLTHQFRPECFAEKEKRLIFNSGGPETSAAPGPEAMPDQPATPEKETVPEAASLEEVADIVEGMQEHAQEDLQNAKKGAEMVQDMYAAYGVELSAEDQAILNAEKGEAATASAQERPDTKKPEDGEKQVEKAEEAANESNLDRGLKLALTEFVKALAEMLKELSSASEKKDEKEKEKNAPKGSEDAIADILEGRERSPEAGRDDFTRVQNAKLEAQEIPARHDELEQKYRDLGDQIDAIEREAGEDSTKDHRSQIEDISRERADISRKLTRLEERQEGLEKEQQRREGLVTRDWEKALEGAPDADMRFVQNIELGGDGDDLVLTLRADVMTKDMEQALNELGGVTADVKSGTVTLQDLSPNAWIAEGPEADARQRFFDRLARIAGTEKTETPPETTAQSEQPQEQAPEQLTRLSEATDREWQGVESLVEAHGENPDMLAMLDSKAAARMKGQLENFIGTVDTELAGKPDADRARYVGELKDQARYLIARIDAMPNTPSTQETPPSVVPERPKTVTDAGKTGEESPENQPEGETKPDQESPSPYDVASDFDAMNPNGPGYPNDQLDDGLQQDVEAPDATAIAGDFDAENPNGPGYPNEQLDDGLQDANDKEKPPINIVDGNPNQVEGIA